jgi:hypothetical protein
VPSRAARDLAELGVGQAAQGPPVEFGELGEGDVVDIHVQAHADRVGGHEIVDVARLVERDLRVARARGQRAEHQRATAALAAHEFGDRIDLGGRERHRRRAARQARDLARAGVGQRRQPRPLDELDPGDERADQPLGRGGPHEHRLLSAARVQQPVGEHMAALAVGDHLDFVDRQEGHVAVHRHGFDRADEPTRVGRHDAFLARDQRHGRAALDRRDALVILAREQAQREADHPRGMAEHPLDRQMGLAGIGRPENGRDLGTRHGGSFGPVGAAFKRP